LPNGGNAIHLSTQNENNQNENNSSVVYPCYPCAFYDYCYKGNNIAYRGNYRYRSMGSYLFDKRQTMKKFFNKWFNLSIALETLKRNVFLTLFWFFFLVLAIFGLRTGGWIGLTFTFIGGALFSVITILYICLYEWIYFERKRLN